MEKEGWKNSIRRDNQVNEIYECIRKEQNKKNWNNKAKLSFLKNLNRPWKDLELGWYVLRSNTHFPCTLTVIQKNVFPFGLSIFMFVKKRKI